jgi:prepilin peptidase CpaA
VFGRIDSQSLFFGILVVALIGATTDVIKGQIYNWLTLTAMIAGLVASAWLYGWSGFAGSLLALVLGFLLYGWIFILGAMGAGDVKFLMALGAWGSPHAVRFVVNTAILGILLGGGLGLMSLTARGKLVPFLKKLWRLVYSLVLSATAKDFEIETPQIDSSLTIPFGVPIALAAIGAALGGGLWIR